MSNPISNITIRDNQRKQTALSSNQNSQIEGDKKSNKFLIPLNFFSIPPKNQNLKNLTHFTLSGHTTVALSVISAYISLLFPLPQNRTLCALACLLLSDPQKLRISPKK